MVRVALGVLVILIVVGCGAPPAGDQPAQDQPAAESTPVFDDGFESGEPDGWQPGESGDTEDEAGDGEPTDDTGAGSSP